MSSVSWHSHESKFTASALATILCNEFKILFLKLLPHLQGTNELTLLGTVPHIHDTRNLAINGLNDGLLHIRYLSPSDLSSRKPLELKNKYFVKMHADVFIQENDMASSPWKPWSRLIWSKATDFCPSKSSFYFMITIYIALWKGFCRSWHMVCKCKEICAF